MVNVPKLKAKMTELEINVDELSKRVDMDRATFYRKLSAGGQTFLIKEADAICRRASFNQRRG